MSICRDGGQHPQPIVYPIILWSLSTLDWQMARDINFFLSSPGISSCQWYDVTAGGRDLTLLQALGSAAREGLQASV